MPDIARTIKVIKSIAIVVRGPLKILNNETRIYSIKFDASRGRGTLKTKEHSDHYGNEAEKPGAACTGPRERHMAWSLVHMHGHKCTAYLRCKEQNKGNKGKVQPLFHLQR